MLEALRVKSDAIIPEIEHTASPLLSSTSVKPASQLAVAPVEPPPEPPLEVVPPAPGLGPTVPREASSVLLSPSHAATIRPRTADNKNLRKRVKDGILPPKECCINQETI